MTAILSSLSDAQRAVCRQLPYPIAAAWQEVLLARGAVQLEQRLHTTLEVICRCVGALAVCEYLRGPVVLAVEPFLQGLDNPQPEHWAALCRTASQAIRERSEPAPFLHELVRWALNPQGNDADGCQTLERVLQLRQERLRSTSAEDSHDHSAQVEKLCRAVIGLLQSLAWLGSYRFMRVVELTTTRDRSYSGLVQFLVGGADSPEPVEAMWTAHLLLDVVYLCDSRCSQLLEISPFVRVLTHPRSRKAQCFLFELSRSMERLTLVHDTTHMRIETAIASPEGEISFDEWFSLRGHHNALHKNVDRGGTLRGDSNIMARRHISELVVRPIPDLSPAAFRQGPDVQHHPSSALSPLHLRRERWLLAAKVGAVLLMVLLWAQLLGPGRRRAPSSRPLHTLVASAVAPRHRDVEEAPPPLPPAKAPASPNLPPAPVPAPVPRAIPSAAPAPLAPVQPAPSDFYPRAMAQRHLRPTYAVLTLEEAFEAGDVRAAPALATLYASMGQGLRGHCARAALAALRAQPNDPALLTLARRCGADPSRPPAPDALVFPGGKAALTWKLYTEATSIMARDPQSPAQRGLARDLYADAASRGLAKGQLGLAHLALDFDGDRAACRSAAQAALAMGGAPSDRAEAAQLIEQCR